MDREESLDFSIERGESDGAVAMSFLCQYHEDELTGNVAPLAEYLRRFPGYEVLIRSLYRDLEADSEPSRHELPGGLPQIGPYRVLRWIGGGGQARVYLAEDPSLGRHVALKVLRLGHALSRESLRRFRREAALLARVEHPAICPIYDAGQDDGIAWIAMRHVPGTTLRDWSASARERGGPEFFDALLDVFVESLRALELTHAAGIVHRDLKPGNVMIDPDGRPVLLDFGLARDLQDEGQSLSGELIGTPSYMAPEQILGAPVDHRCDLYSMGVTLFECATGSPAFRGATREELYKSILDGAFVLDRRTMRGLPRGLVVVLEIAMAREPSRRFESAADFADELERVRRGQPVRSRRPGALVRLGLWAGRNRRVAALVLLVFVSLGLGLFVSQRLLWQLEEEQSGTRQALRRARALALSGEVHARAEERPDLALQLALHAHELDPSEPARSSLYTALLAHRQLRSFDTGAPGRSWVELSEDRKTLFTATRRGGILAHDLVAGGSRQLLKRGGELRGFVITGDRERMLTLESENRIVVRSLGGVTRQEWSIAGIDARLLVAAPRGERIAVGDSRGVVWVGSWREGVFVEVTESKQPVLELLFDPKGEKLVVLHRSGELELFDAGGQRLFRADTCARTTGLVRFTRDGELLAFPVALEGDAFATQQGLRMQELESGRYRVLSGWGLGFVHLASAPEPGSMFACMQGGLVLWMKTEPHALQQLQGHQDSVYALGFRDDGRRIATGSNDCSVRLWGAQGEALQRFGGHAGSVVDVRFLSGGRDLVSVGVDGQVFVWDATTGLEAPLRRESIVRNATFVGSDLLVIGTTRVERIDRDTGRRHLLTELDSTLDAWTLRADDTSGRVLLFSLDGSVRLLSPSGAVLARVAGRHLDGAVLRGGGGFVGISENRARIFDASGKETGPAIEHPGAIRVLVHDLSQSVFATGGDAGRVGLWSRSGELRRDWRAHDIGISALELSPDGSRLVSAGFDGSLRLWDGTGELVRELAPSGGRVFDICFSPNGRSFVTATQDGDVDVWSRAGEALGRLRGHSTPVTCVAFAPDARLVATASQDGEVRIFSTTGALRARIPAFAGPVQTIRFSPEGTELLACDGIQAVLLPVREEELLELARKRTLRSFDPEKHPKLAELLESVR